ncbi:MAG TPA: diacylglycerol kinase family protein [Baekduia sp.]|nr:diacylglycerol kinase family protein [Baekduia sp.]
MKVAVVAHSGKKLGGGLPELRRVLADEGVTEPLWYEVPKSRKAPRQVRRALENGAELVFVWGGDGMVQRCADVLAGSGATLAIIPAGTANLLASSLEIPKQIGDAVAIGLHGDRRPLDVGRFKGERFAVMAGVGFDAEMLHDASGLKGGLGRAGYVWGGLRNLRTKAFHAEVKIDGVSWYEGPASCILIGNIGELFGGLTAFEDARPDDGILDIGVVTAEGPAQMARTVTKAAVGNPLESRFVRATTARAIKVKLDRKVRYELDGGDRSKVTSFKVKVEPGALAVRVPRHQTAKS